MNKKRLQRLFLSLSFILTIIIFYFLFFTNNRVENHKDSGEPSYLVRPYFRGVAEDSNLYEINADKAIQVDEYLYDIDNIYLKYYLDNQKNIFVSIASNTGKMNERTKLFKFLDNVEMIYSIGYRGVTDKLDIDFKSMVANTSSKLVITGAKGKLSAEHGFDYLIKTKKMFFKGPIKTVLINQKL